MIATDKARREEFIRLMLEVAAKTVGVNLPELPISEMITVRRGTEEIAQPGAPGQQPKESTTGYEDVPFEATADTSRVKQTVDQSSSSRQMTTQETVEDTIIESPPVVVAAQEHSKILHLMVIVPMDAVPEVAVHVSYVDEEIDQNAIASLISALDSFGGIDGRTSDGATGTNALETIEHEGNLVMVEKSKHFVMALIVTNDSEEKEQRGILNSLLIDIEQKYEDIWDTWKGNTSVFEPFIFEILSRIPLKPISLDYIVRAREAGRPLPFSNRDVGSAIVDVQSAIEQNETIGSLVRSFDLPRETVLGCLQILNYYGWIDFKVEIGPRRHMVRQSSSLLTFVTGRPHLRMLSARSM
jgi:hypothetical protein